MKHTQQKDKTHELNIKLDAIARHWAKWNAKEITGEEFAYYTGNILDKRVKKAWQQYLELKCFEKNVIEPLKPMLLKEHAPSKEKNG